MSYGRLVGDNIALIMNEKHITSEELAKRTGFSLRDVCRLIGGSLFLGYQQLEKVAAELETTVDMITNERDESSYRDLIHCMGRYNNASSKNQILDYIDAYIDLEEMQEMVRYTGSDHEGNRG